MLDEASRRHVRDPVDRIFLAIASHLVAVHLPYGTVHQGVLRVMWIGEHGSWRGTHFMGSSVMRDKSLWQVRIPLGVPIALLSVVPLIGLVIRKHKRSREALRVTCPRCRYDLTGNVSGVCPEMFSQ